MRKWCSKIGAIQWYGWVNPSKRTSKSIAIAQCSGHFDFQYQFRDYLTNKKLVDLKKPQSPSLKGNKITRTTFYNDIKLINLYAYVMAAQSKFPVIFNTEEEQGFSTLVQSSRVLELCRTFTTQSALQPINLLSFKTSGIVLHVQQTGSTESCVDNN